MDPQRPAPVRFAVVDTHDLVVAGIRRLADLDATVTLTGCHPHPDDIDDSVDVVWLADRHDGRDDTALDHLDHVTAPTLVVVEEGTGSARIAALLDAGAGGIATRAEPSWTEWRTMLHALADGQRGIWTRRAGPMLLTNPLTPREQQISRLLVAGTSVNGVAAQLGISAHTVKEHNKRIYHKLGIRSGPVAQMRADLTRKLPTLGTSS